MRYCARKPVNCVVRTYLYEIPPKVYKYLHRLAGCPIPNHTMLTEDIIDWLVLVCLLTKLLELKR